MMKMKRKEDRCDDSNILKCRCFAYQEAGSEVGVSGKRC